MILVLRANKPGNRVWLWWRGRVPGTRRPARPSLSNGTFQVPWQTSYMLIVKIITNSCIIIQSLSQDFSLIAKLSSNYWVLHYVLKISLLIYIQFQFVPNKLKFSRSGIWMMPLRSPWPWGKDTRIKCISSIFLVFAIFVFLPSNNFGATNRACHGLGLMRQKCGCNSCCHLSRQNIQIFQILQQLL